jgi:hypothetical protein
MKKNNTEKMTKTEMAWRNKYAKGNRSAKATAAHAKYCRLSECQKNYMNKQYNDPESLVKPKIILKSAIDRAKEMGCWVDASKEDYNKQLAIYHECHKMNLRDGKKTWSVDHIVPLCLKGPHCSSNLQIMPFKENVAKGQEEKKIAKLIRPLTIAGDKLTR